jgi:tight adherence protein C
MDINAIMADLAALTGGSELLPLILLAGTVFFAVVGIAQLFRPRDNVERRLSGDQGSRSAEEGSPESLRFSENNGIWAQLLKPLEKHVSSENEADKPRLRKRLLQAGYLDPNAVRTYYAARIALVVILPAVFLAVSPFVANDLGLNETLLIAGGLAALGLYLPYRVVQHRLESRQQAIQDAFPDSLDMMVVCVEAGLGMDSAFSRVGSQLAHAHPIMAQEFGMVALSLRAGKTREQSLRDFAERTGVADVVSFVTLLIQSEALGASIAQTLRVQADEMRDKRMMRAEERAHKLPVQMVVPLVTCILPAMLIAVLLPGLIGIIRNIMPALGN